MSLVVNTNVSSLTAQRALADADSLQGEAMTRLSTGSKINSASDDAAGLAIASRMTSQVQGLNMAVKNANDGISLTQSIEGALVETTDMLQRLRELSVQAANDTNTGTDRAAIQEEVDLLIAEINRISSNTRYNNQKVLDGSFTSKSIQVGTEGGEAIGLSVVSSAAGNLGSYTLTGDRIEARLNNGAGSSGNATAATDDFIVNGKGLSRTIDVAAQDSAKAVATKINSVSGETGVTASAKTYANLYSEYATDKTASVRINGKSTGQFVISSTNVSDAVNSINNITGSTGVIATATSDGKIRVYSSDGSDISIENESTFTDDNDGSTINVLRVQTVGFDGQSTMPTKLFTRATAIDAATAAENKDITGDSRGALNTTYTLVNRSTNQTYSFSLAAATTGEATAAEMKTALNNITGVSGFEVKAVDNDDGTENTGHSTFRITATESFGNFDIYEGSDISIAAKQKTDVGIAAIKQIDDMHSKSTGTHVLVNKTTGDTYEFQINDITDTAGEVTSGTNGIHNTGKIDADELAAALNGIEGLSGFTVETHGTPKTEAKIGFSTFAAADATANSAATVLTMDGVAMSVTADGSATVDELVTLVQAHANFDATRFKVEKDGNGDFKATNLVEGAKAITLTNGGAAKTATAGVGTQAGVDVVTTGEFFVHGAASFGDFDIKIGTLSGASLFNATDIVTGDKNALDVTLAGGNSANDTATVQGTLQLSSSDLFSVTQRDEYENGNSADVDAVHNTTKDDSDAPNAATNMRTATGSLNNDNYFTSQAATMKSVDTIDLRSQSGADAALAVIDGAIEKVSSMRSSLGAIENRLDHTVSNLMNIAENTESARSRIQDADFAAESAKLSKAQVLKQAGVGMLAQANASSQLVLQLLQ